MSYLGLTYEYVRLLLDYLDLFFYIQILLQFYVYKIDLSPSFTFSCSIYQVMVDL